MAYNIHLIPFDNKWAVKEEGSKKIISFHRLYTFNLNSITI